MVRQNNKRVREQKVAEKEDAEENVRFKKTFPENKIGIFARCERKIFIRILQNHFFSKCFRIRNKFDFLILHQFVDGHGVYHDDERVGEKKYKALILSIQNFYVQNIDFELVKHRLKFVKFQKLRNRSSLSTNSLRSGGLGQICNEHSELI